MASWSFEPPLAYLDTIVSSPVGILPPYIGDWTIGVMSKPDLTARGFTIQRYHPLDTIERRRAAVEQFTDRQWKYFPLGHPLIMSIRTHRRRRRSRQPYPTSSSLFYSDR